MYLFMYVLRERERERERERRERERESICLNRGGPKPPLRRSSKLEASATSEAEAGSSFRSSPLRAPFKGSLRTP